MGISRDNILRKLAILGMEHREYGWAIITKRDGLYGFIDISTGTIVEPTFSSYNINDWFFYGMLPNPNSYKLYDKGHFYIRGIKDRQFKRTQYLDVKFGQGDFRVASVGNTKLRGKDYLVNYQGKKIFLGENALSYGAKRIEMTKDGLYIIDFIAYDDKLNIV